MNTPRTNETLVAMCYFNAAEELNDAIKPNKIQIAAGELMPLVQAIDAIPELSRKISLPNREITHPCQGSNPVNNP